MIKYNETSHLLEQHMYDYSLQDVEEPNLFRDLFPYSEVPKTTFNHRRVPMQMPREVWITDTTFRDGQQSRAPYTAEQIADLYTFMHQLGGPNGIIRQTEFFVYSEKDRRAIELCQEKGFEFPEITTWIRATKEDYKLLKNLGIRETGVLVSCSDYHIFKKLHMTRRQALEHYVSVVADCIEAGIYPRCHLEDITRADFYGFVIPFVHALMELSEKSGIPVKIRACDTLGYGVPIPGAGLPRSVPGIIYGLRHYADLSPEMLEWHGHNDFYMGVANAVTAWLYGASSVNCSLLGIGERTGNIPLEAMVFEYASLKGTTDGMDTTVITEIANYYRRELHYEVPPMTPFIGRNFNVTRAGIHADGLLKDEEIYNIFDTKALLNAPASVAVSNTSGLAGIAFWINERYHLTGDKAVNKKDPLCQFIKQWVDSQYAEGRVSSIADEELEQLIVEYHKTPVEG